MKYLLAIPIMLVSLSVWSQSTTIQSNPNAVTTQTPALPPTPFATATNAVAQTVTNGVVNQLATNFFGTNGLFTGDAGLLVRDLQANVDQLRSLLTLLASSTPDGTLNAAAINAANALNSGTVNQQSGQDLGSVAGANFSTLNSGNFSQSAAVTPGATPITPQSTISPTVSSGFGTFGTTAPFGNNVAGTTDTGSQFSLVELQLLSGIQASLLAIQFDSQQLLPILSQAVALGGVGNQFGTNTGFGALTNAFTSPLTNAFGAPLTNAFGVPLTNIIGTPLTNTFGGLNQQLNTPAPPTGPSAGGNSFSGGSPSTGVGTSPQSPSTGSGAISQGPSTGVGSLPQSPSTGSGTTPGSPSTGSGASPSSPSTGVGAAPGSPSTGGAIR